MAGFVHMPTFFIPPYYSGHCPMTDSLIDRFGGVLRRITFYPQDTGSDGSLIDNIPFDPSVLEIKRAASIGGIRKCVNILKPDWTLLSHLWYNNRDDVEEIVRIVRPDTGKLVVACRNSDAIRGVPDDVVIGIHGGVQKTRAEWSIDLADLVDREVCLIGGIPTSQWLIYCMLVVIGAKVVGIRMTSHWYLRPKAGGTYFGPNLKRYPLGVHSWKEGAMLGVANVLGHWVSGIQLINAHLAGQ